MVDGRDLQAGRKAWWAALGKTANAIEWGSHQPNRTDFDVALLNLGAKTPVTLLVRTTQYSLPDLTLGIPRPGFSGVYR